MMNLEFWEIMKTISVVGISVLAPMLMVFCVLLKKYDNKEEKNLV